MEKQEHLKQRLCQKLEKELKDFKDEIKEKGVDFAIDKAYELTSKQEIIDYLQYDKDMSNTEIKAILPRESVLDELYDDWLSFDGNMREHIGYSVEKSLNFINDAYVKNIKKDKNYTR